MFDPKTFVPSTEFFIDLPKDSPHEGLENLELDYRVRAETSPVELQFIATDKIFYDLSTEIKEPFFYASATSSPINWFQIGRFIKEAKGEQVCLGHTHPMELEGKAMKDLAPPSIADIYSMGYVAEVHEIPITGKVVERFGVWTFDCVKPSDDLKDKYRDVEDRVYDLIQGKPFDKQLSCHIQRFKNMGIEMSFRYFNEKQ